MRLGATRRRWLTPLTYLLWLLILCIWVLPLVWLVFSSLQPSDAIARSEISPTLTFDNYFEVFERANVGDFLVNSILVACGATALAGLLGIPAAYSIARWSTGGRDLAFWILSSRMMPPAVSIIPFFIMYSHVGIIDTVPGLVIAHLTFSLAFVIWMTQIFIQDVPVELEEAAQVDGASLWHIIVRVVLPVARSGILATLILNLVFSWNEYLFAFGLSLTERSRTLPVVAGIFVTSYQIQWGQMFAAAVIIMLPILVFVFLLQRYIVGGLTMGAIK
ncbi:MAG: carbohydrate ABC transporter permease [Anaerolineae bacterium]|nr:carbohydrate ABC transporter permease [Anaerolineae bacterium]